jgi:hypothetical protein
MKRLGACLLAVLASLLAAGGAEAAITPTRTATDLAAALAAPETAVTGASFADVPPSGNPNAVSDVPLGGFPTVGPTYGILSTGDAQLADDPNTSTQSGTNDDANAASSRGPTAHDVSVLRIDIDVPATANCLAFGFRFESEEFPEYVNQTVNDGFIAELDTSDWSTNANSSINAPHNFAFDPSGQVISINSSGATSMSAAESADTTYDGATPRLSAAQAVTPGPHSLYLSIFDQTDSVFDSAVFVDGLDLLHTAPDGCVPGAQTAPPVEAPPPPPPPPVVIEPPPPPVPVQGTTVTVGVVSGKVRVKLRGSSRFVLIDGTGAIPVGSTVDATAGRVRLSSAAGGGKTQTAEFYKGTFQVLQSKGQALTELKLGGPSLASCAKSARSSAKKKPVRRLFGDGKGSFRTRGRHAAATVRGTKWLTQDTCAGTLVRVSRGKVSVRDFTRRRTVTVRAGKKYLARPPR